jgi:type I restriction enzyme M protein
MAEKKTNGKTTTSSGDLGCEPVQGRRQAARQHGAVGLQARRAGPDLPQAHLRRFEAKHAAAAGRVPEGAEDPDEYLAENVFWVPKEARWSHLQANAKQPDHRQADRRGDDRHREGQPVLKGVLPKDYARPALNKVMLGELIDLISGIALGEGKDKARDLLGRVYEYFLGQFAGLRRQARRRVLHPALGRAVLVEMLEPYKGRVYDPCCGSGGMFVQSEKFVEATAAARRHRHLRAGEQLHHLAAVQDEPRRARHRRRHPLEQRRQLPQGRTARPARRLHPRQPALQHLRLGRRAAARGCALAYGTPPRATPTSPGCSTSCITWRPPARRAWCWPTAPCPPPSRRGRDPPAMVEADVVDCMIALPGQLFYSTQIPACLWFLAKDKSNGIARRPQAARPARRGAVHRRPQAGHMVDRTRKEFSDADIAKIADTYHAGWRLGAGATPTCRASAIPASIGHFCAGLFARQNGGMRSSDIEMSALFSTASVAQTYPIFDFQFLPLMSRKKFLLFLALSTTKSS